MPADLQTYSNPWLKVQCLRVGSTINRGPPDTNFVGESNPTSQTLNTLTPKIEHAHSKTTNEHKRIRKTRKTIIYIIFIISGLRYNIIYIIY